MERYGTQIESWTGIHKLFIYSFLSFFIHFQWILKIIFWTDELIKDSKSRSGHKHSWRILCLDLSNKGFNLRNHRGEVFIFSIRRNLSGYPGGTTRVTEGEDEDKYTRGEGCNGWASRVLYGVEKKTCRQRRWGWLEKRTDRLRSIRKLILVYSDMGPKRVVQ